MTKWIVGMLLVANLALFAWMRWGAALTVDSSAATAEAPLNADKIRLLSLSASAPVAAPVSAPASAPGQPAVLPGASSAPPPASGAAAVPAVAAEPAAVVGLKPKAPSGATKCAEWGEFSGNDLARAKETLAALNLGTKLSERSVQHMLGYWVYIPPPRKHSDVEKRVALLKRHGVNDYFVLQEKGKWLNAISLGVFRTKEAAEKYLVTLHAKGVRSAKLGERASKRKFTVFVMKELDPGTADKLRAVQKDFQESELKVSACGN